MLKERLHELRLDLIGHPILRLEQHILTPIIKRRLRYITNKEKLLDVLYSVEDRLEYNCPIVSSTINALQEED